MCDPYSGLSNLLHYDISLPDATSCDKSEKIYAHPKGLSNTCEPRHAIMCLREINYVMRYDVVKSDVIISRCA